MKTAWLSGVGKIAGTVLTVAVAFYFFAILFLFCEQRSFIYPVRHAAAPLPLTGAAASFTPATVRTADGLALRGVYAPPRAPDGRVIVVFHGNAAHHSRVALYMAPHVEKGDGVLATEYRGYAGNPGRPSEQGLYADGRAWIDWLIKEKGVKPANIVIYGQSVGTGVATQMALEYPGIEALILFAPFTSLTEIGQRRFRAVPVSLLMLDRYRNLDKIGSLEMPVLIIAGTRDLVVPPAHGQALYEEARGHKFFAKIEGYGHTDLPASLSFRSIEDFLSALPGRKGTGGMEMAAPVALDKTRRISPR